MHNGFPVSPPDKSDYSVGIKLEWEKQEVHSNQRVEMRNEVKSYC